MPPGPSSGPYFTYGSLNDIMDMCDGCGEHKKMRDLTVSAHVVQGSNGQYSQEINYKHCYGNKNCQSLVNMKQKLNLPF